jgi:hypothetical protein
VGERRPEVVEWINSRQDEVAALNSFVAFMVEELAANSHKGDRPGWLTMTPQEAIAELLYHAGKLAVAVRQIQSDPDPRLPLTAAEVREYAADTANCALMVLDVCGLLMEHTRGRREEPGRGRDND